MYSTYIKLPGAVGSASGVEVPGLIPTPATLQFYLIFIGFNVKLQRLQLILF